MRTIQTLIFGLSVCYATFGCQEEEVAVASEQGLPEDAEIIFLAPEEEYFRAFEAIPYEGGFLITEAPQQTAVSEFALLDGKYGYLYKPRKDLIGNDLVVLEMCASIGGFECYDTVLVAKLGFVIGNNRK